MMSSPVEQPALRTPEELARALNVKPVTVYAFCRQGRIESVKVGRLVRIPPAEFDRVLKEGVPPLEEQE